MARITPKQISLIKQWVKTQVSQKRYQHIAGVARTASKLALRYKLSVSDAQIAAWFHDCAKELSREEMTKWINKGPFKLDEDEKKLPALWHPHAGASIALNHWKIRDKNILEAIRCHTLGSPAMLPLAQVLFVADFIEPGRDFSEVKKIRMIAQKSLQEAVLSKCALTVEYLLSNKMKIHGRLLQTWNVFLQSRSSK